MMNIIIAYSKPWYKKIVTNLMEKYPNVTFYSIETEESFTESNLNEIKPDYIFLPHWSFIIKENIYKKYNCVIFHMTDLPFGRGGSPLQNLIARGIYETKISAIRCVKELDAGPVYLKTPLSLYGNAEEIYMRAASTVVGMISEIIEHNLEPVQQVGDVVEFKRRQPHEGNIAELETLEQVYDYIRMLDAKGYPKAFIETEKLVFEFERSALKDGEIHADVRIKVKEVDES